MLLHEGNFEAAVFHAEHYLKFGMHKAWWNMHTFAICNEIFASAHLVSRQKDCLYNNKNSKQLFKLAVKSVNVLKKISQKFPCAKSEYDLAQGRILHLKGREVAAQKLWAQAIYMSDTNFMLPTKARACLEVAKNCSKESLAVRQYYAKAAGEIFKNLGMKRCEIKANVINTRLKPSLMNSSLRLSISAVVGVFGDESGAENNVIQMREKADNSNIVKFDSSVGNNNLEIFSEGVPLTGRDEELSFLMKRAGSLRTDIYVGAVLIEGDAGFGKSALLRTFLKDTLSAYNNFSTTLYSKALELEVSE